MKLLMASHGQHIKADAHGRKHFLAIDEGFRESTERWKELLLKLRDRGLKKPPKLAVGDGAKGFWAALSEVYLGMDSTS